MSQNNDYRKLQKPWGHHHEKQRAIEKEFYEKSDDNPPHKKKVSKKGKPRSDHKHEYMEAEIFHTFVSANCIEQEHYIGQVCTICHMVKKRDYYKEQRDYYRRGIRKDATHLPKFIQNEHGLAFPIDTMQHQKEVL